MGSVLEVLQSDKLAPVRKEVELFTKDIMQEYLKKCQEYRNDMSLNPDHTKNFYDSVWGTIEINEGEILILDSPVLQRLRQIKQLGLADFLYSSADHSRFAHTLGVLQTADVMSRQVDKELKKKGVLTEELTFQIIRLSAVFHDCGHMFGSHASEIYFQKNREASLYPVVFDIQNYFKRNLDIKPSLSEIISILIVNSSSVRALLNIVQQGLYKDFLFNESNQNEIVEKICCMIIGFPYSEKMIPYSKIISGQIDADKLDYLQRDSHSTGVPVAVDMSRVFQKLRVVPANKRRCMIASSGEPTCAVYKLAIAPAAINTVDQLVISRYMMFENIYYHQKTLTAEETLRYAMSKIDHSTEGLFDRLSNVLRISDCMIINKHFEKSVKSGVEDKFTITDKEEFKEACSILANLNNRYLFKRCAAFTDSNLTQAEYSDKEFYSKIIVNKVIEEQKAFVDLVISETKRLKILLKNEGCHFNARTDILLIIAPDISSTALNSNIAIADKGNKDRDMIFEADKWLQSRASRKPQNYLVSYTEDRYLVYIATETVLLRTYGILMNDTIIYTEDDEKHIKSLKEILDKKEINYFQHSYVLAPNEKVEICERRMQELVDKWAAYEVFDVSTGSGFKLNTAYLALHLKQYRQFCDDNEEFGVFVNGYLDLLDHVQIISKEGIVSALFNNFKQILQKEECDSTAVEVCNIGNYQDGSAQIAYHINIVNQVLQKKWLTKELNKVLEKDVDGQIIVFLEDAFCSGKQILSIFETYMGIPLELRQTQEEHVEELSDEFKKRLCKCKLYFSFIYYEKHNEEFFYNRMREIGLTDVRIVAAKSFPDGYFKARQGDMSDKDKVVMRCLDEAGKKLIGEKAYAQGKRKLSWDDKRMADSTLGYNNAQQLIAFVWNTPTYTITPLWMRADSDNFRWIPLFPRIDK